MLIMTNFWFNQFSVLYGRSLVMVYIVWNMFDLRVIYAEIWRNLYLAIFWCHLCKSGRNGSNNFKYSKNLVS